MSQPAAACHIHAYMYNAALLLKHGMFLKHTRVVTYGISVQWTLQFYVICSNAHFMTEHLISL